MPLEFIKLIWHTYLLHKAHADFLLLGTIGSNSALPLVVKTATLPKKQNAKKQSIKEIAKKDTC